MTLALILMALMALLTVACVAVPLWRGRVAQAPAMLQSNAAAWRQQRDEIVDDFNGGVIDDAERDRALADLTRRAANDLVDAPDSPGTARPTRRRLLAVVLSVLIVALGMGLYLLRGTPIAMAPEAMAAANRPPITDAQISAMVAGLAEKLREHPDDLRGWTMLARSHMVLGHINEAVDAYQHALTLAPDDAQLLADGADVLAVQQGNNIAGKPYEMVMHALKSDPNNLKALALAATAEQSRGNAAAAIAYWQRIQTQLPPDSDDARQVAQEIAALKTQGGPAVATATPTTAPAPGKAAAPAATVAPVTNRSVSGRVDIAPALAGKVALTDMVYIFARATGDGAPRMPLAVLRVQAKELPRDFELTDAMAMAPGVKLSDFANIVVEARISKGGGALPQPGDLQGTSAKLAPGARGVNVMIDHVLP